jgi:tRNA (cytidine/uridine-2'-O-)-methyltransferase
MFQAVLIEPEIPSNTGNIGRTCLALNSELHLVGRLGFRLDDKALQRAGLDYWTSVKVFRHPTRKSWEESLPPDARLHFFSTKGARPFWEEEFQQGDWLVFGRETTGFPPDFYDRFRDRMVAIPQPGGSVRSLNLATAAGIGLYEAYRQIRSKKAIGS